MKTIFLLTATLSLAACLPMQHAGMGMMMGEAGEGGMLGMGGGAMTPKWPTIRIDGINGARVKMQRGVFGDGLHALVPFQGSFQPTGEATMAAYPLEIDLDEATSRRYGVDHEVRLRAFLRVPEATHTRGILRIAPTDCELRALLSGDVDKVKVMSEELPTAAQACAHEVADHEHDHDEPMTCGAHREHGEHHRDFWAKLFHHDDRASLTLALMKE